jgi:hypothetical protein
MSELVSLEKAAELLGLTPARLNDLRLKNEIFGTREGSSWKFRIEEIQRFAEERNISLNTNALGEASGILLDDDSLELDFGSADALLQGSSGQVLSGSGDLSFGTSELAKAGASDVLDDESSEPGEESPSDTGKLLAGGSDLQLSEDDLFDDEISLGEKGKLVDSAELSSDFEDSDLVLEDSDSSEESALQLQGGDSGISLSANDSGISFDEPFSLGGSDIDDLELPEDDDIIALEESAGPDSATLLGSDDNFDLTPLEDSGFDDSASGSQVIALEDSGVFADDSAPTMLGGEVVDFDESAPVMLDDRYAAELEAGATLAVPEVPYTWVNVLVLSLCLLLVTLGTMVAFDAVRSMWQPEGTSLGGSIANMFVEMLGYEP